MRKLILLVFCVFASLAGCDSAPSGAKNPIDEELAKFQGVWKVVSHIENDTKYLAVQIDKMPTIFFDGANYTWSDGKLSGKIVKLDPTKTPKTVDYEYTDGRGKIRTNLGIYEIEGDTLKDCFAPPGEERPKEFVAKAGSNHTLMTYKRVQ